MPVAVVNGGTRGIGKAIASALSDAHYDVHAYGRGQCDARDPAQVRARLQEIRTVDVLVNCAGIFSTCELDRENTINVLGVFHTNVLGYLHWIYAVLPGMQRRSTGYIINISSMAAKRVRPGCSTYALTKAAVCSVTDAILKENAHLGIRATAICPGDCDTQMGHAIAPDAELIPTADIAHTVLWLLSLSKTSIVPEVCIERRGRY